MKKLDPVSLNNVCDADQFNFETTEEIKDYTTILGQDRLSSALQMGVEMDRTGYNIFALGPQKTDKETHIRHFLQERAKQEETPPDICYVNNFDDSLKPDKLLMPAGRGRTLQEMMDELLEDLIPTLESSFETEEYQNRRQALKDQVQQEQDKTFEDLQQKAKEKGLALIRTPSGFSFAPTRDGNLMSENEVQELPEEERKKLEEHMQELQKELQEIIQKMPANKRKVRDRMKKLDREIATYAIKELFKEIRNAFSDLDHVQAFLNKVETDIVENVQAILGNQQGQQGGMAAMMQQMSGQNAGGMNRPSKSSPEDHPILQRYRVNVLVDHQDTEGAPVIYEDNPSYKNLLGRVEYKSKMGALTTNFNLIKPGALHKANGGYLVLDARRVLLEPFAWEGLKRAIKSGDLKIESLGDSYSMISTVSLEPEPLDLKVKVVLLGERLLYYMLCNLDPDFNALFKIEADFEDEMDRNSDNQQLYSKLLAGLVQQHDLRHFDKHAVSRVIEQSARMVGDNEKLSTQTEELSDLLVQADFWAGKNNHDVVQREDVQQAIDQQLYRASRIRDKIQESIERNQIFIDTEGTEIGQVNGLSVIKLGELMFGKPNRITARIQIGKGEIIDIEREVDMSGPIHSKGVLILKGFLGDRYAQHRPLSLSASLVFEQSYSNIDGDSASSAELYALLSAIGKIPLRQSLSVTGSVNQHGKIQPIGGVNEKIEGFFDVCKKRGLTGEQGVLIPRANVKNLMLRQDVVDAAEADQFHIYAVETVDEGMEILTGMEMGMADEECNYPDGTINARVVNQLDQLAQNRKAFASTTNGKQE
ncbi:Lon protease family protein [Halalkalibaculum sp. DA3122]|uniref:Lon protease family protein n=1 Tax=Halalkalibaculum sp. DA3122 TaxID=3373607 RepID=UPI003754E72C